MANIVMLNPFPDRSPLAQWCKKQYGDLPGLSVIGTDEGLEEVYDYYEVEYHLGSILEKAAEVEKRGDCDAFISGCYLDPGLEAIRQVTSMPVLGTGEISLCTAAMLGEKIGVISAPPAKNWLYVTEKMIHSYHFSDRVVAVRPMQGEELNAASIPDEPFEEVPKIVEVCLQLIRQDGADVVILGCMGYAWAIDQVRRLIANEGFATPIIEPGITVYNAARMVLDLGLNQDRRKFPRVLRETFPRRVAESPTAG